MGMGRLPLEISLDVVHHCIETEIKRQYNRCISAYFKSKKEADEIEKAITLLQYALENFDFQTLRGRYPELAGQSKADVALIRDKKDNIILTLNKKVIFS
jgi:hypothetical protein